MPWRAMTPRCFAKDSSTRLNEPAPHEPESPLTPSAPASSRPAEPTPEQEKQMTPTDIRLTLPEQLNYPHQTILWIFERLGVPPCPGLDTTTLFSDLVKLHERHGEARARVSELRARQADLEAEDAAALAASILAGGPDPGPKAVDANDAEIETTLRLAGGLRDAIAAADREIGSQLVPLREAWLAELWEATEKAAEPARKAVASARVPMDALVTAQGRYSSLRGFLHLHGVDPGSEIREGSRAYSDAASALSSVPRDF